MLAVCFIFSYVDEWKFIKGLWPGSASLWSYFSYSILEVFGWLGKEVSQLSILSFQCNWPLFLESLVVHLIAISSTHHPLSDLLLLMLLLSLRPTLGFYFQFIHASPNPRFSRARIILAPIAYFSCLKQSNLAHTSHTSWGLRPG